MLFDSLIVDEAAQAIEPATLVPFRLLKPSARIVLVGDPKQLPPTVLSGRANKKGLGQSMFERFSKADYPVTMLTHQYRMHPRISRYGWSKTASVCSNINETLVGNSPVLAHAKMYLFVLFL